MAITRHCSTTEEVWGQCQGVYPSVQFKPDQQKNKKNDKFIYAICCYVSLPKNRDRAGTTEQLDETEDDRAMVVEGKVAVCARLVT